jgi:hypothetical protein
MGIFSRIGKFIKKKIYKSKIKKDLHNINTLYGNRKYTTKKTEINTNKIQNMFKFNKPNSLTYKKITRQITKKHSQNNNISEKTRYYYNLVINELNVGYEILKILKKGDYLFIKTLTENKYNYSNYSKFEYELKSKFNISEIQTIEKNLDELSEKLSNLIKPNKSKPIINNIVDHDVINTIKEIKRELTKLVKFLNEHLQLFDSKKQFNIFDMYIRIKQSDYKPNIKTFKKFKNTKHDKGHITKIYEDEKIDYQFVSINKDSLYNYLSKLGYQNIAHLINTQIPNPKDNKFSYNNSKTDLNAEDHFFNIRNEKSGLNNLYDWYIDKNPQFRNLSFVNPQVPEYLFITAVMAKDLSLLHSSLIYPLKINNDNELKFKSYHEVSNCGKKVEKIYENFTKKMSIEESIKLRTNIESIFTYIESFINRNKNKYLDFIEILQNYITIFSYGDIYKNSIHCITKEGYTYMDIFEKSLKSPFMLYPTLMQLSYDKVVYTLQAPVINFRLTNKHETIHNNVERPSFELYHDVGIHGEKTHLFGNVNYSGNYKELFKKTNNIIQNIKSNINYSDGDISIDENTRNNKLILAGIIFTLVHEHNNINALINLNDYFTVKNVTSCLTELSKDKQIFNIMVNIVKDKDIEKYNILKKEMDNVSQYFKKRIIFLTSNDGILIEKVSNYIFTIVVEPLKQKI